MDPAQLIGKHPDRGTGSSPGRRRQPPTNCVAHPDSAVDARRGDSRHHFVDPVVERVPAGTVADSGRRQDEPSRRAGIHRSVRNAVGQLDRGLMHDRRPDRRLRASSATPGGLRPGVRRRQIAPDTRTPRTPLAQSNPTKGHAMVAVQYVNASRIFEGNQIPAVNQLDLDIADGEFMVLVGPSGSGKSTALRMMAGLEDVDEGEIRIGGQDVSQKPPKDRDIAMVFQNYALYPHMTVAENMGFALKLQRVSKDERNAKVRRAAELLDLEAYLDRKPKALSGGQRQRVAMGRAIVREPSVFLMDEPLSNLDAKLRVETRANIAALQARLGTTTIYVTHDQVEAMTMGDRVALLKDGILQQ